MAHPWSVPEPYTHVLRLSSPPLPPEREIVSFYPDNWGHRADLSCVLLYRPLAVSMAHALKSPPLLLHPPPDYPINACWQIAALRLLLLVLILALIHAGYVEYDA